MKFTQIHKILVFLLGTSCTERRKTVSWCFSVPRAISLSSQIGSRRFQIPWTYLPLLSCFVLWWARIEYAELSWKGNGPPFGWKLRHRWQPSSSIHVQRERKNLYMDARYLCFCLTFPPGAAWVLLNVIVFSSECEHERPLRERRHNQQFSPLQIFSPH